MSTKTTLKRIALVAVSALGFGLMSSIAPASAGSNFPADNGLIRGIAYGDTTQSSISTVAREDIPTSFRVYFATGSTQATQTQIEAYIKFSAVPAAETVLGVGSNVSPTVTAGNVPSWLAGSSSITATAATSFTAPAKLVLVGSAGVSAKNYSATSARLGAGSVTASVATVSFTPNHPGTYKVITWVDDNTTGNTDAALDGLERNATKTITVGGAPTTMVVTPLNANTGAVGALTAGSGWASYSGNSHMNQGTVYQVSVKDAAGNLTSLTTGEAIKVAATDGTLSDASLTGADFNKYGYAYVSITGTAATVGTLTATAVGFTASTITASYTATLSDARAASVRFTQTTGLAAGSAGAIDTALTGDAKFTFQTGKAVTMRVTSGSSAAATSRDIGLLIVDEDGDVTGDAINYFGTDDSVSLTNKNPNYSVSVAISDTLGYGSVTLPTAGLSAGDCMTVVWPSTNGTAYSANLCAADAALNATQSTISPASANIVTGGGVELTARCVDQFAQGLAGCSVSWNVTALTRNATATPTIKLADANGYSTYTLTDTSTSTTVLSSTVTATMSWGSSTNTETATITFGSGNAVDSITVDTSPTKTVATTESTISTAATGPEGGAVTLKFLVKDATGVTLTGVPVTLTADKGNVSWKASSTDTANNQLVYTDSTGIATTYISTWVVPTTVTVTATAGTKSVTTKVNFVSSATTARTIAVTAANGIAKATVKDRYGNPVKGATVSWSRTGTGYFGSGVSATTGTTDVNGESEILFVGDGTVKAELDAATYTQCANAAGAVGTTATSGTGASLAPAGICSATAALSGSKDSATKAADAATAAADAAADAAAEAIDAANAATDAANLAAEAADAATVAAEEARDAADAATAAVEELATQVATLMAALKAQITTLANTVAKIAKKVKA